VRYCKYATRYSNLASFVAGLGRVIDLGGTTHVSPRRRVRRPPASDMRNLASDWNIIANDFNLAARREIGRYRP